ncbi:MAG: hypothetical protein IAI49_07050, partial [Candidatus Eremiobacteraeota bacterium]|nr:hypothetical protein [Candidatus Eremiobacteraeota bacterium]
MERTGAAAGREMHPVLTGFLRSLFVCALVAATSAAARADVTVVDTTMAPIVRIDIAEGDVTVRTWDRQAVSIDGDPSLTIAKRKAPQYGEAVPIAIGETPHRGIDSISLPQESFVTAPIRPGSRDVVLIKSTPATPRGPVTVLVPSDAVFVSARAVNGRLDVADYRGGTLMAITRGGAMTLSNVGGTVFAQTLRGPIVARGSLFDRIRARSLFGNVTFERCTVRQIEVTTVTGSIVYDGGSFEPGLARFESSGGNVAIGASGNVQYGAHAAGDGRVYTN